ncbi:hypothetical protein QTP70_029907, partial [Hemibagrus guttatus]
SLRGSGVFVDDNWNRADVIFPSGTSQTGPGVYESFSDLHISEDLILNKTHRSRVMVSVCRLLLFAALLLCLHAQLSVSQHWSHGWYPGGKREIDSYSSPEVSLAISGEIKLCEAGECSYLKPLRTNILKSILVRTQSASFYFLFIY